MADDLRTLTRAAIAGLSLDELERHHTALTLTMRRGVAGPPAYAHKVLAASRRVRNRIDAQVEQRLAGFPWSALPATVLVICGASATGKTRLAETIAEASRMPRLSSDRVWKDLAGVGPHQHAPRTAQTDAASLRTYRELGLRTAAAGSAIVDATFRRRSHRAAFLDALGPSLRPCFVECIAPATTIAEHAHRRALDPHRESDAIASVALTTLAEFEPLDDVPAGDRFVARTDRSRQFVALDVMSAIHARACGA
jgi:predicted kinase